MIRAALGAAAAGFMLFDPARQHLVPAGSAGTPEEASAAASAALAPVFAGGEPRRVDAPTAGGAARGFLEHLAAGALMAVPIAVEAEPCGVLYVAAERPGAFGEQDLAFLTLVAGRVGLLLGRAELTRLQREIDRQRAQAAARQEFLGIVTHELKTPVAVLRAYTEVLLARAEQAGRAGEVELLQRVDDQAERLLGMVEQVLDLQRLDAGLFPLEIGRVDLAAVAARVLEGLQLTAANVRLRLDAEAGVDVRADRRRIEQVLINLVQNAIRFSPPGGEVVVRIRHAGPMGGEGAGALAGPAFRSAARSAPGARWVLVSVSDQGPGVSEEDRARIFARFYQGKGGDKLHRGHGGLGVGLYIAREIVARHGGDLWLEPAGHQWRGGVTGATFTFLLPVAGPDEDE
jgi:signal transduction histidine kinase